jgi:hypothetical protein
MRKKNGKRMKKKIEHPLTHVVGSSLCKAQLSISYQRTAIETLLLQKYGKSSSCNSDERCKDATNAEA